MRSDVQPHEQPRGLFFNSPALDHRANKKADDPRTAWVPQVLPTLVAALRCGADGSLQMNKLAGTWKYSASLRACALLMDRFPLSTSETTLLDPNTGIKSRCRMS